ncbi:MAG TPA: DUF1707 domain-containing protein [Kineosporiaceae bacterium]|nr:DUF1707 domain-containing protein [Kineosporiaceae bacterium]
MAHSGDPRASDAGGQRIGSAERDAVVAALQAHYQAGRLTPEEYEDRSVRASKAMTWEEIAPLFADLPEPRPAPVAATLAATTAPPAPQGLLPMPDRARDTIMSLTPLVALLLFFVTHTWLWFLAIPIVAILLYGSDRGSDRRRRS